MNRPDLTQNLGVLKRVEWSRWSGQYQTCPICLEARKYGHRVDCELLLAIERCRRELAISEALAAL